MSTLYREPFVEYHEALEGFAKIRKEMNDYINDGNTTQIKQLFDLLKFYAGGQESIAMDLLAYYYKSGIKGVIPENYQRYIQWEILAAAKGNELAVEKLQFLIGYACDAIMEDEQYDLIEYKNDIDENNVLYVLGKNLCKVLARDFLKIHAADLAQQEDELKPYTKEDFIVLRKMIDEAIPKTIAIMKS